MEEFENIPKKAVWKYFLSRLWEQKKYLIPCLIFALGSAASQVWLARSVGRFADETLIPQLWSQHGVYISCLLLIGLIGVSSFSEYFHKFYLRTALERMAQKLRVDILSRYLSFSETIKNRIDSGSAINHVVTDVQLLSEARHFLTEMIQEPLKLAGLLGYVIWLNWKLSVICVLALLPIGIANNYFGKSARRNQQKVQKRLSELISHTNENFQGMRTVHAFLLEKKVLDSFRELMNNLTNTLLRITRTEESVGPFIKIISALCGAVILYAGAYMVAVEKSLTPGQLISFAVAAGLLQAPLKNISYAGVQLQRISAGAYRIWTLFNIPFDRLSRDQQGVLDDNKIYAIPSHPLPLKFDRVSFAYPTANSDDPEATLALSQINFTLEPGKKIALVGKSGSGKTTLSLLTLRLIDPTEGQVQLDGRNVQDWELGEYRAYFSYVSQEVYFFQGSFRDNLLKAAPGATDNEMWRALELAQLKEKIARLPDGIHTSLTEKAANLSGGERQRLAIARAILRNSPVLILDEATSSLDSENEKLIQRGLEHLLQKKSAIIVAHRLSTILGCDEILVFDRGQIVERGSPAELRTKESAFSRMWAIQQGEAFSS